jgi:hypothetical protein
MSVQRTNWDDLGQPVRDLIEAHTGPVHGARTVTAGLNSQLAAVLDTAGGEVFVKGLHTDHPGVVRQHREAMINPCVLPVAPRLRWQAEGAGWNLLAFDYLPGTRHADYTGIGGPAGCRPGPQPAAADPLPRSPGEAGRAAVGGLH